MPHSPSYRRILHRMGYYDYQRGLIFRHLNQHSGWDRHLERCRSFIIRAVEMIKPSVITVLGSGWLLELPLAEIVQNTRKIRLVDIVHPPQVIAQISEMQNVALTEMDVSGGLIEEVWKKAGRRTLFNKLPSLETIYVPEFTFEEDPGMIISLNILTQLEILPEKLLARKSTASNEEFMKFKKEIQEKHIRLLGKHPSVIISDVAEITIGVKGVQNERKTLLAELPEGRLNEEWVWDFDLLHADFKRRNSVFKVIARVS